MTKGGYQIIDLGNHPHELEQGASHEGIYEKIEGTSKPILLSGIVVDNIEYHDTYIFPCVDGSNFVAVVGDDASKNSRIIITIEDTDVVTFRYETSPN